MKHTIDLKNIKLRTDLVIETINDEIDSKVFNIDDLKITEVILDTTNSKKLNKKPGTYITIEFDDITDIDNERKIENIFKEELKKIFDKQHITSSNKCLVIGLGNRKSTPDALGPLTADKIIVTHHLYDLGDVDPLFSNVCSLIPGVTGETGMETNEIIKGIVDKFKPDFVITIDALASLSVERVNKTIQMTDTGITPGSGVGNSRKEISKDTLNIPVISIGVPTVVDAISVVSDTLNYMQKHYAFHKKFFNNAMSKLVSPSQINYLKENVELDKEDRENLLGLVGNLSNNEIRALLFDVLTPIGYNLMVTPKEIDFVMDKLVNVLSNGINKTLHKKIEETLY